MEVFSVKDKSIGHSEKPELNKPCSFKHPKLKCCNRNPQLIKASGGGRVIEAKCIICGKKYILNRKDFIKRFQNYL
jgi:hypothetical protein